MHYNREFRIGQRVISLNSPTYFIADIAANHDGDLARAQALIRVAKESGADAVKFQHFTAEKIVSDYGFKHLGNQLGHQANWKKSVFEVYKEAECNRAWTEALVQTAREVQVDFFSTPYDSEAVELLDPFVPAYKIGSGDITWPSFIQEIARKHKPVLLAAGASTLEDVQRAVTAALSVQPDFALMQCNTNYTGSLENFRYVNLLVLKQFASLYPGMILGLSDHTPGHSTVLGAVALGARVIEKHFTDDNDRQGPDHPFSMNPTSWRTMVEETRRLEQSPRDIQALAEGDAEIQMALGDGQKRVEENELQTVVLQRRSLRLTRDLKAGEKIRLEDLESLRPCPADALPPYRQPEVVGKVLQTDKVCGDTLLAADLRELVC